MSERSTLSDLPPAADRRAKWGIAGQVIGGLTMGVTAAAELAFDISDKLMVAGAIGGAAIAATGFAIVANVIRKSENPDQ